MEIYEFKKKEEILGLYNLAKKNLHQLDPKFYKMIKFYWTFSYRRLTSILLEIKDDEDALSIIKFELEFLTKMRLKEKEYTFEWFEYAMYEFYLIFKYNGQYDFENELLELEEWFKKDWSD